MAWRNGGLRGRDGTPPGRTSMATNDPQTRQGLMDLLVMSSPDPRQQEWRIYHLERNLGLPVKACVIALLAYYLIGVNWQTIGSQRLAVAFEEVTRGLAFGMVQYGFLVYVAVNVAAAFILVGMKDLPRTVVAWTVFTTQLLDSLSLAALVVVTGGLESSVYWVFLVLITRNCLAVGAVIPKVFLNASLCAFYVAAIVVDALITQMDALPTSSEVPPASWQAALGTLAEIPFLLRLSFLVFATVWCSVLLVVIDRMRRRLEEEEELQLRSAQLESSGRLAAEIAHQLKNPLAIINNASYTLQKTVKEGKTITQQIRIIREEVERSDRLITELMGYAKLAEGRVEKLNVREEIERALARVFPPAVQFEVQIHRDLAAALPDLLLQRNHLEEILDNLLQNAREAMNGRGNVWIRTAHGENHTVVIAIADDGPGIPPEHLDRIFEPYYSTREKGSGLGLAIVRHNTEIYGGRVDVESELGKGTRFTLTFPARTLVRLRR